MSMVAVMWTIWGILAAATALLHVYCGSLTKDEDDQIYLDEAFEHEKQAQAAIIAKVNKIEPILKVGYWLIAIMSVVVIVYYVCDILRNLGFLH